MENGQIYAAISAAMADISAIGKDKYNQQRVLSSAASTM